MYDYIAVGCGIESIINLFFISNSFKKSKILIICKNHENLEGFSTTFGIGVRHVSPFEGVNFMSKFHIEDLSNSLSQGGWLCNSKAFEIGELDALEARKSLCRSPQFCKKVENFYIKKNIEATIKWRQFLEENKWATGDIDLKKGLKLSSNLCKKQNTQQERLSSVGFSINVNKLCNLILERLKGNGVEIIYETEVCDIKFNKKREISYITTECKTKLVAKNYLFCPGAYGNKILKCFKIDKKVAYTIGIWMQIHDISIEKPFKYHYFGKNRLLYCQNYTPVSKSSVLVSGGIGWVGNNIENIDKKQSSHLAKVQKKIVKDLFPGKNVTVQKSDCLRVFTTTNLPLLFTGKSESFGRYVICSGSATFGTSFAVLNAEKVWQIFAG